VLVVGGGFVGSHVAEALAARGEPTRVVARSEPTPEARQAMDGAELLVGDVLHADVLGAALDGVSHVVHCAGSLTPADSMLEPAHDLASLGPLVAVLERLRSRPGVGVTYVSSGGTVYGEPRSLPVPEDHPTEPIVPYGIAKLAGEKYIGLYNRVWGVPARILRCANLYGDRQPPDRNQGAVAVFLDRLRAGRPLVVVGDGSAVRDFLYVRDLAGAIATLPAPPDVLQLLNVGSGVGTSLRALIRLLEEVTDLSARVEHLPARPFDVRASVLDISRLRTLVDFEPVPLREGLQATWAWLSQRELEIADASASA
jgi:UDP-glucose 4-epimerase